MTELALFDSLLATDRTTEERLDALDKLRPFLETDEAAAKLADTISTEQTIAVRKVMVELFCSIDSSRITDREKYWHRLAFIASLDPERSLRYAALNRLSLLSAHLPEVQEILSEIMINDLDPAVQLAAIGGLLNNTRLTAGTIARVVAFIPQAPASCRPLLLQLAQNFPQPAAVPAVLHFLDPFEQEHLRLKAVNFLAGLPELPHPVKEQLAQLLMHETNFASRQAIIRLLSITREIDRGTFRSLFAALQHMPDQPELLALVGGRLSSDPTRVGEMIKLFTETASAGLKIRLLSLLKDHELPDLLIAGLKDPNPFIREAVIPQLTEKFPRWQTQLEPALAEAIRTEPLLALRSAMTTVLLDTGRKSAETEALLPELAVNETDHYLKTRLATVVAGIAITGTNRKALLSLFAEVMENPWYSASVKQLVAERLQTYAYTDEPELKKSLGLLLDQAKDMEEVDRIYQLLKTLQVDFSQLTPVLLRSLYRHIAYYAQQPLHEWVQLLGRLAEQQADLRAELPWLISLTGASWLLTGAEKADQSSTFLPAFKQLLLRRNGTLTYMEAQRMLTEAYNNRTLKRSDVVELYRMLLALPKADGILQQLLSVMQNGKLVTPELVRLSLGYILRSSDPNGVYEVRRYLEQHGAIDLTYRDQLLGLFNQQQYQQYMLYHAPNLQPARRYTTFNDWEYSGWYCPYSGWPVAALVFALEPGEFVFQLFEQLPDPTSSGNPTTTLQYLVLEHLFRNSTGNWAKYIFNDNTRTERFLSLLYNNYQQLPAGNALKDRLLYTFWKKWNEYVRQLQGRPVPQGLADAAAYVYTGVNEVLKAIVPDFNGKQYPEVLKEMNPALVREHWPWSPQLWDAFEYKYFPKTAQKGGGA